MRDVLEALFWFMLIFIIGCIVVPIIIIVVVAIICIALLIGLFEYANGLIEKLFKKKN